MAVCYNCGKNALQAIRMLSVSTTITCTNCGAERIYNIHGSFETNCNIETDDLKRKYDVWHFAKMARCPGCGDESEHKVTIDEYNVSSICPDCCFTRLYKIAIFTHVKAN